MNSSFSFLHSKKVFLSKLDKSKKGSIDKKIEGLCNKINKSKKYYTTSSCSGRIVIIKIGKKKNEYEWLYTSHEKIIKKEFNKIEDIFKEIWEDNKLLNTCWIRFEPAILHVSCATIGDAQQLLDLARNTGFKLSGIISAKKNVVEIRASERLDIPLSVVLDVFALDTAIIEANKKLDETHNKIKKLTAKLSSLRK
jgi:tRNA wybutosine-synthesizing protein 3